MTHWPKKLQLASLSETQEFFSVTEKRDVPDGMGGSVMIDVPNGKHRVKILSEKLGKGKSFNGKDQDELQCDHLAQDF